MYWFYEQSRLRRVDNMRPFLPASLKRTTSDQAWVQSDSEASSIAQEYARLLYLLKTKK